MGAELGVGEDQPAVGFDASDHDATDIFRIHLLRHRARAEASCGAITRAAELVRTIPAGLADQGVDAAGAECGNADALGRQLVSQRLGVGEGGVLAGAVHAERDDLVEPQPGHRDCVHDVRLSVLRSHAREEGLDAVDDAVHVDREGPVPIGLGRLADDSAGQDAGVVDEQVELAEFGVDLLGQPFVGNGVGDVEVDGQRLDLLRFDLCRYRLRGAFLDIGEDDVHPLIGAGESDTPSDPGTGTGYQRHFAAQFVHRAPPFCS